MEKSHLLNLVEQRRQLEVQNRSLTVRTKIIEVSKAVEEAVNNVAGNFETPRDVFTFCGELDKIIIPDEITELFKNVRREILSAILDEMAEEKTGLVKRGDVEKVKEIETNKQIYRVAAKLLAVLKNLNPESFGPQWIRENASDIYLEMTDAIRHQHRKNLEWEKIVENLPIEWQKKYIKKKKLEEETLTTNELESYRRIAELLGQDALAEVIDLLKGKKGRNHLNIVKKFLGKVIPSSFTVNKIGDLPDEILDNPNIRKVVFNRLRNQIYQELLGEDGEFDREKTKISDIHEAAAQYVKDFTPAQARLYEEIIDEFKNALKIKTPARIVNRIADKEGQYHAFPSLRQRFAMKNIDRRVGGNGKLLVSFFMGGGKTGTSFLVKEHVESKKMLFLCPKPDLVTQTAERISKYYRKGQEPTVGIIEARMSEEEILQSLRAEVVVVSFTLFNTKMDGRGLVDVLKDQDFDMMVVDEVHNARNEDGLYSRSIKELAFGIKNLYEKGHIMLLSGDPIPNRPDDIAAYLTIADRETFGEIETLRGALKNTNPLQLRNKLLDFMLILDPPEQWQEYVETVPLEMSVEETLLYESILQDDNLTASDKIHKLRMAILNPALLDAATHQTSTMAETIGMLMVDDFEDDDVIVFAEPCYKTGVLRKDENNPEVPTTIEQVKHTLHKDCAFLDFSSELTPEKIKEFSNAAHTEKKLPVIVAICDGDTTKREKRNIKDFSKFVGEYGAKMAIFAQAGTIREGIDLSHINRAYMLSPEFNQPDLAQFVKRFRRETNNTAHIGVFIASGTIMEGIQLHAQQKAILCDSLKYGRIVNSVELGMIDETDNNVKMNQGSVVFGTHFAGSFLSAQRRLRNLQQYLHGKSAEEQEEFVKNYGQKYADLYTHDWEFSRSAQNGRLVSAVISNLISQGDLEKTAKIADVACGPLVLANTLGVKFGGVTIDNFDINHHMLSKGVQIKAKRFGESKSTSRSYVSKMDQLLADNVKVEDSHYDCVNLGNALNFTSHSSRRKGAGSDERVRTILEQNRVLKKGGILIITLPHSSCSKVEFENFKDELRNFGFEVMSEYSGFVEASKKKDNFNAQILTARKVAEPKPQHIRVNNLQFTPIGTVENQNLPDDQIINVFQIGDKKLNFSTAIDDHLKNEILIYNNEVERAREVLHQVLEKKTTPIKFSHSEKKLLKSLGIIIELPEAGYDFWKFSLSKKPYRKHKIFEQM